MSTALVTGASEGLGRALCARLARDGWNVVIDARDEDRLLTAVAGFGGGSRIVAIPGDVSDPAHRRQLVAAASLLGGLDLLVNNASTLGASPMPRLREYPLDVLRAVLEVNLIAPLALWQEVMPLMAGRQGTVINITSDAAVEGYEGWGGYGASKAALEQVSRVIAAEHPDQRVYWVDPGDMNTRMHQDAFPGEDISDRPAPEESVPGLLALVSNRPPSGRYRAREVVSP
ncbi:MAG: SDR family oxidoreductase [Candidatus Dormibacteria bacterium]